MTTEPTVLDQRWESLRRKIDENATYLQEQGTVVPKKAQGRTIWVIRFRALHEGRRIQRTIRLGDDVEIVERARGLLAEIKERPSWPMQLASYAGIACGMSNALRRLSGR